MKVWMLNNDFVNYICVVGSPLKNESSYFINHKCMGPGSDFQGFPPNPEQCWAVRAEVTFPSCWNGQSDSSDHNSHMAYPGANGEWESGPCPITHPFRLPTLFFEVSTIYKANSVKIIYIEKIAHLIKFE